jgi:MFS family permease
MGVYYLAPLLGPALAPLFGGALTNAFGWRAAFWFLAILAGIIWLCFLFFFKDTFRRERSLTYQDVLRHKLHEHAVKMTGHQHEHPGQDVEKQEPKDIVIKLSIKDMNPVRPIVQVLIRFNNLLVLLASGESQKTS